MILKIFTLVLFLFIIDSSYSQSNLFEPCTSAVSASDPKILQSLNGRLQGSCFNVPVYSSLTSLQNFDVFAWKGIPYAEPPINQRRFMRPEPIQSWNNIRNATQFSKACVQNPQFFSSELSEDCLYLNVFVRSDTYRNRQNELKPILVFIHGGGLEYGSSSEPNYEPSTLVALSDVIVVTLNYRLNYLGFLHFPGTDATGNQGFLDQSLALKWISDNADRFGGDASKITIFGESAGAWSVNFHLFYPGSWPYFRNAIMQSGGITGPENPQRLLTVNEATARTRIVLDQIGCGGLSNSESLQCAQNADNSRINSLYKIPSDLFRLNIDGYSFNKSIDELVLENSFKQANIITGFNTDEMGLFVPFFNPTATISLNYEQFYQTMSSILRAYLPSPAVVDNDYISKVFREYFGTENLLSLDQSTINYPKRNIRITSDPTFICPSFALAEPYSNSGLQAYVYEFNYRSPKQIINPSVATAVHFDEIEYVFADPLSIKTQSEELMFVYSDADRIFSRQIIEYWTNFAKYDNPNNFDGTSNLPVWTTFNPTDFQRLSAADKMRLGRYLLFQNHRISMKSNYTSFHCEFWKYTTNSNPTQTTLQPNLFNSSSSFSLTHCFIIFVFVQLSKIVFSF